MKTAHILAIALIVLLAAPAFSAAKDPTMSLSDAVKAGNVAEVKLHITAKTDLNAPDPRGTRPLATAVVTKNLEIATLLLKAGADPTAKCRYGVPIIRAVQDGRLDMVKLFVTEGGVDVNGQYHGITPLSAARRQPEVDAWLREQGAVEPRMDEMDPYGNQGLPRQGTPRQRTGRMRAAPPTEAQILADPNAIRAQVRAIEGLEAALKAIDANSASEMRSWRQRNIDNRTALLRSVEKQFNEEMAFVKLTATQETGPQGARLASALRKLIPGSKEQPKQASSETAKTEAKDPAQVVAAVDALVALRTPRYKAIYDELRDQRRAALQEKREQTSRSGRRGRGSSRGQVAEQPGSPYRRPPVAGARPAEEPAPLALDPDGQAQLQAWATVDPLDKRDLLNEVHELDIQEYGALHQVALKNGAAKTATVLAGLLLARQDRLEATMLKIAQDDERLQRLQERSGNSQYNTGTSSRRGRRSR